MRLAHCCNQSTRPSNPLSPGRCCFMDQSASAMRLGVPGTEAVPHTDSPSHTGRMPPPHPETNPAESQPLPPRSPAQPPRPHPAELNTEQEIPTAHLPVPIPGDEPWPPSQHTLCGSHPRPAPWFQGCGHNRNLPVCWQRPSQPDRYRLLPADSTCFLEPLLSPCGRTDPIPFTTSESPLHSSASLPGFCRR